MRWCLLCVCFLLIGGCDRPNQESGDFRVADALGDSGEEGFARATEARAFDFPRDHGPHPTYRNEWWYLTGNLRAEDGRTFGFQVTFFRIALLPEVTPSLSAWRTNQIWMGHAALSDLAKGEHWADERFARQGMGLAGSRAEPFRVWLEDWQLADEGAFWRLRLRAERFEFDLSLVPDSPVILQGDRGLSQKSGTAGNASYYYSVPRLQTSGRITQGEIETPVAGLAWFDREWSTSALGPEQAGWDWFSLQLRDGRNLMYYQMRLKGGGSDSHGSGSLSDRQGLIRGLEPSQVDLTPIDYWQGYPIEWRLRLQGEVDSWRVRALLPDQEMDLSVRYWEGAVEVVSETDGTSLGRGYLELSGYR